ncbi:MAG TPA: hypothetical protein VGM12_31575, partial [Trebonia sp.]
MSNPSPLPVSPDTLAAAAAGAACRAAAACTGAACAAAACPVTSSDPADISPWTADGPLIAAVVDALDPDAVPVCVAPARIARICVS